jgi:L-ascorbate metabolism protein UlaG (beta-lactamase superfamily)
MRMTEQNSLLHGVTRGTQSTLLIANGKNIWIDPFQVSNGNTKADLLFITHAHGDHLSASDIQKVIKPETLVVGPPDCIARAPVDDSKKMAVAPGETHTIEGIEVEVVPAYNVDKPFHPRSNNWVGYIINVGGRRVYHAGDTDRIPEMKNMRTDVALLPIGGTYTMDAQEAAAAINEDIKPRMAVPMHYGAVVGSDADAQRFKALVQGDAEILPPSL